MKEALAYYRKAADTRPPDPKNGDFTRAQAQAKENIAVIRTFEMLDLKLTADGRYTATSTAFNGPLTVEVVVKAGRIASVKVTQHNEKQFYSAMTETPQKIVERQSVKDIDACTGATITSEAIINATAKALAMWDGGGNKSMRLNLFVSAGGNKRGRLLRMLSRLGPSWSASPVRRMVQAIALAAFGVLFLYVSWPYGGKNCSQTLAAKEWVDAEIFLGSIRW